MYMYALDVAYMVQVVDSGRVVTTFVLTSTLSRLQRPLLFVMSVTDLKRTGKTNYKGMLVAVGAPQWRQETKLYRFIEKDGCSTLFTVSQTALPCFASIYAC